MVGPTTQGSIMGRQMAMAVAVVVLVSAGCGGGDSEDAARLCEINAELEQMDDFTTASPDDARAIVSRTRDLLDEAETVGPDEVSSSLEVAADSFRDIMDFFEDADFDVGEDEFEAAVDSGEVPLDPPEAQVLFDWLDENCGAP